jgi:hypothetical protein
MPRKNRRVAGCRAKALNISAVLFCCAWSTVAAAYLIEIESGISPASRQSMRPLPEAGPL